MYVDLAQLAHKIFTQNIDIDDDLFTSEVWATRVECEITFEKMFCWKQVSLSLKIIFTAQPGYQQHGDSNWEQKKKLIDFVLSSRRLLLKWNYRISRPKTTSDCFVTLSRVTSKHRVSFNTIEFNRSIKKIRLQFLTFRKHLNTDWGVN